jgi:hypothetical protein
MSGHLKKNTRTSLMTKLTRANRQLPHSRLHDLRHLHATTLLLAGVPVHIVAARLGHADPAITLRVYAHVIRLAEAAAADIFAEAVRRLVSKPVSKSPSLERTTSRKGALAWEPPIGIEPMTYALRGARSRAAFTLAAPIPRIIALTALAALGLYGGPVTANPERDRSHRYEKQPAGGRPAPCGSARRP